MLLGLEFEIVVSGEGGKIDRDSDDDCDDDSNGLPMMVKATTKKTHILEST